MANKEQLAILKQGVEVWNKWRKENPDIEVDLSGVDLSNANLDEIELYFADLSEANLKEANLNNANLVETNLSGANLRGARLYKADLERADLSGADLSGAYLVRADLNHSHFERAKLCRANLTKAEMDVVDLSHADLSNAHLDGANLNGSDLTRTNLSGSVLSDAILSHAVLNYSNLQGTVLNNANLSWSVLVGANLTGTILTGAIFNHANLQGADLSNSDLSSSTFVQTKVDGAKIFGSRIYGISVWDLEGEFEDQKELIITPYEKSIITVDNIKVAQFIYLILNNKELRDVINTLTSKAVLILGRFSIPERKAILDALRDKLREYNLLPIVFDFDRPVDKDFTETIKTLAGLSFFVIADITNPQSSPLELQATVPDFQIPFVPIIQEGEQPFAMMVDLQKKYSWVLPTKSYDSIDTLMKALKLGIIDPAVEMRNKLRLVKAQEQVTESLRDYVDKTL